MIRVSILVSISVIMLMSCNGKIDKAKEKEDIKAVLFSQQKSWNDGDLLSFMEGYVKSDSLSFIGSRGVDYGWDKTLQSYKKGYPTQEHMGKLRFEINHINILSDDIAFLIGRFYLIRNDTIGNASGTFSLLFQKIDKKWKILSDHTSVDK